MIQYIGLAHRAHRLSSLYISVINIAFGNKSSCNVNNHHTVIVHPSKISFCSSYRLDFLFPGSRQVASQFLNIIFFFYSYAAAGFATCFSGSPPVYAGTSKSECVTFFDHDSANFLSWSLAQLTVTSTSSFSPPSVSAATILLPRPWPARTAAISAIAFFFWALRAMPRSCLLRMGW